MQRVLSVLFAVFMVVSGAVLSVAQAQTDPAAPPATPETTAETTTETTKPAAPTEVIVGVYLNDIQQLDLQTHSYVMDFYLWFRWQNPDVNPQATLEFMNPYQLWGHINTPLYEAPQDLPDGWKYTAIRYQGQFNSKLPLEKYPFDTQNLIMEFEDNSSGSGGLKFVPDKNPITINPELTLPGYLLGKPTLIVADKPYPTNFGDTRLTQLEPYSHVTINVPVHRPWFTYAIKVILPIFLVAACAALVFWIHPSYVEGRIGMGITALLTLVALQLTSNSQLPEVDYLMMIDMLFIAAYFFVIASLAQAVRTCWDSQRGNDHSAVAKDRTAFKYLGSLYVVSSLAILLFSLAS
jgi:hypothetical protein